MNTRFLFRKLCHGYIWKRIALERLTEPLHLNIISLFVLLFGSFRAKVAFDLVLRQHNAYALLIAADQCKVQGIKKMAAIEFGVASGGGLMNMAHIANKVTQLTGVEIKLFGFDSGVGLPTKPIDYRDHPEHYEEGEFKMDVEALKRRLPKNAELVIGEIKDTVAPFLSRMEKEGYTIGYVVIDVDYYSSARDALALFGGAAERYLPLTHIYLDDIADITHNPSAGELLAVEGFNGAHNMRKIYPDPFLENRRIFRRANWIKHMRLLHVQDAAPRKIPRLNPTLPNNPYL